MSQEDPEKWIVVTEDARTLPVEEILTGRGFITGKSGSGKSNTASVIAEELLSANYNLVIIDTEGEYFGLKEQYELLHVGADEQCEVQVDVDDGEKLASIILERNIPIIVDVSGFLEADDAEALIHDFTKNLFQLEKQYRKPLLMIVEEIQEYIPQSGGKSDLSELLLRVAKRGRKRGLGMCGISQRPSAVDKDFITQCDWLVWHRLSWPNDVEVVRNILGDEPADEIDGLADGEGYLMTDWDEQTKRVQFRKKKTFDAGATPGLQEYERPDLQQIGEELRRELEGEEGFEVTEVSPPAEQTQDRSMDDAVDALEIDEQPTGESEPNAADINVTETSGNGESAVEDDLGLLSAAEPTTPSETTELPDDPAALKERIRQLEREKTLLQDEVRELKQIMAGVDNGNGEEMKEPRSRGPDPKKILEEPRQEGTAGFITEFGLLVSYLLLTMINKLVNGLLWIANTISSQSNTASGPYQSSPQTSSNNRLIMLGFVLVLVAVGIVGILLVGF